MTAPHKRDGCSSVALANVERMVASCIQPCLRKAGVIFIHVNKDEFGSYISLHYVNGATLLVVVVVSASLARSQPFTVQ